MPKFKQTSEILRLMRKKENIRNVGIIAHIDHGKTTMTDSLLAEAGLLSPKIAGEARALDYLEEEQKRGITIKTANISLLHEIGNKSYVVNLVDTPGHVDFTGKVARALRAVDGAVVVVDAVEGVMAQTETVTRQALEERVKPVLFINKVDRLIKELKLTSSRIQTKLECIIKDFNSLVEVYGEPEFKDLFKVDPQKETVALGSALHKWGFTLKIAQEKGIKFTDLIEAYKSGGYKSLEKLIPLHEAILEMVAKNLPNPIDAQKYRLQKIWKGKVNSEIGKAMLNCDDYGPTVMCITMSQMDPQSGLTATGRLFSGSVKEEEQLYLVNAGETYKVHRVFMYMGALKEIVDEIAAGNIAALLGLENARTGETLVGASFRDVMVPFERIKYFSEPVLTIVVEPKTPRELPRLIEAMNKLCIEDPNIAATVNMETGEYLLSGIGELHLEIAVKFLKDLTGEMEISTSKPMVVYREGVSEKGALTMAGSPDKQNMLWVQAEPLEEKTLDFLDKAEILKTEIEKVGKLLFKKAGLPIEEAENVLALDEHKNLMVDLTRKLDFTAVKEMIVEGFKWACRSGPLCEEPLRGVKLKIMDAQIHENPAFRGPVQIVPLARRATLSAVLKAKPVILEPIYKIGVTSPSQLIGKCIDIIIKRRGKIVSSVQKGVLTLVNAYLPVAETFNLSDEMRSATSGRTFWQCTFDHWEKIPESLAAEAIRQIRGMKGLPKEKPPLGKFME